MKIVALEQVEKGAVSHARNIVRQVLLNEHDLPGSVRLSHAILAPGQRVEPHRHAEICEVFYVLGGRGELVVEGQATTIEQGSCFMVEAGEEHALSNSGRDDLCLLYFGLFQQP